jgi:pyruvate kinase
MSKFFKRTKILATVGPPVDSQEQINEMLRLGVNGFRLNFSHGDYEERDAQIKWIRTGAAEAGKSVSILQDLQGPKIRLGMLKDDKEYPVKIGDKLVLDYKQAKHDGGNVIPIQYNLAPKVKSGEVIFIYDGKVKTVVTKVINDTSFEVEVKNDGVLASKKGLNLPDTDFGGDVITEKDMADMEFGASRDFDYVAMSFIQSADDIRKLRQILVSFGSTAQIIAKIETKAAVATPEIMEEIVKATDGIMVARGDMAYEVGVEMVPTIQLQLVRLCRKYSKLCIVATQMLETMIDNPEPTRAEVSDIANAVMQGTDAVMLSGETSYGKYPLEAIRMMRNTIVYTQDNAPMRLLDIKPQGPHKMLDAVADSAVALAEEIGAEAIVCETGTGITPAIVAARRPSMAIISVTDNQRVANQLSLTYANSSFVRPYSEMYAEDLLAELKGRDYFNNDSQNVRIVLVSGSAKGKIGGCDTIEVKEI